MVKSIPQCFFGIPKHTQSMISYKMLTAYFWKFQWLTGMMLTCPIQWIPHCLPYFWLQNHIKRSLMPISEDGRILNSWMEWFTTSQNAIAFMRTDMGWQKSIYLKWSWRVQNMFSPTSKSTKLRLWKWKLKIFIALQHYMPIEVTYNSAKAYVLHRSYTLLL